MNQFHLVVWILVLDYCACVLNSYVESTFCICYQVKSSCILFLRVCVCEHACKVQLAFPFSDHFTILFLHVQMWQSWFSIWYSCIIAANWNTPAVHTIASPLVLLFFLFPFQYAFVTFHIETVELNKSQIDSKVHDSKDIQQKTVHKKKKKKK